MNNPLTAKLQHFVSLTPGDAASLDQLTAEVRRHPARRDLIKEGDRPETVFLLLQGWACRYKLLPDGRRQIVAYLVPGDLCDPHGLILGRMDHSVGLLSEAQVASISGSRVLATFDRSPALTRALWWSTLVEEAVLREWLVNIGQRDAYERIAHLLVELWYRLAMVGLTTGGKVDLPLTQTDFADTLGLTPVHVNRVLQRLRGDGLIELARGRLHIPDMARLKAVTRFDPTYLHLDRRAPALMG